MPAARQDEEFELVLGHKQMMGFFFVVVILFAVFFSFGYTVGYQRGETSRPTPVANLDSLEEPGKSDLKLPETLLEKAPKATTPEPTVTKAEPPPEPPKSEPKPEPVKASPPPVKEAPPAPKQQSSEAPKPVVGKQPSAKDVASAIHLQVAALRVRADADMLAEQLRTKGYQVVVHDQASDGWNRVLVGPFQTVDAAKNYKERLNKDGFETILRKR